MQSFPSLAFCRIPGYNREKGGFSMLSLWNEPMFRRMLSTVVILVLGILAVRIVMKLLTGALERSRLEKAAHSLILSLCRVGLYLLLCLIAASNLGLDVSGIVALASVLTLALSLALQDMVSNVIGGFTILYTHPFHSGDFVEIAGQSGTVREINMTYTMLATPDNRLVSIPNKSVTAAQIVNYSVLGTRRAEILVSASYDAPVQTVLDALIQAGTVDNALLDPAPCAMVLRYGDSAIEYTLRVWVRAEDYWDVYFEITRRVKTIFDEQHITMTYPHLNVHLDTAEKAGNP